MDCASVREKLRKEAAPAVEDLLVAELRVVPADPRNQARRVRDDGPGTGCGQRNCRETERYSGKGAKDTPPALEKQKGEGHDSGRRLDEQQSKRGASQPMLPLRLEENKAEPAKKQQHRKLAKGK